MTEEQQQTPSGPDAGVSVGDEYVSQYMEGGAALAIAKKRMPWWWFALMAVPGAGLFLSGVIGAVSGTMPIIAALLTLVIALGLTSVMALLFSHLRTVVTDRVMHIQLGLWGPKIPLDKIQSIRGGMYDWKKYGGWGIRYGRDGSFCYSVPGGTGQCVEVEWINDKGKTSKHVVSVDDAASIVNAVERARSAIAAGATGVRIDSAPASAASSDGVEQSASASSENRAQR